MTRVVAIGTLLPMAVLGIGQSASQREPVATSDRGVWLERARLPEPRTEAAVAFVNGKLYVLGGTARGQDAHPLNQEYDPATNQWRERAPMPIGLSHAGAAGLNGRVYVVGGFTRNVHLGALNVVFEYDPMADTWRLRAPMKSPRGSVGLAVLDGKLHAVGGRNVDRVTVATHEVYDPATDTWTERAPLQKARDHLAVVAARGRLHAIGGRFNTPTDNTTLHEIYDPATDRWTVGPPLPTARSGVAATLYRGLVLVVGGECHNGQVFVETEAYDPQAQRWLTLAPMPAGRHGFFGAADDEVAYFPGGSPTCGAGASDTLWTFRLPERGGRMPAAARLAGVLHTAPWTMGRRSP